MRWSVAMLVVFVALACAAPAGAVMRWGFEGTGSTQLTPLPIANVGSPVAIDASNRSGYALQPDGSVSAWGRNIHGQLGNNGKGENSLNVAVKVHFPAGVTIVAIGEARASGMAVDSTGQGWAWGEDGGFCGPSAKDTTVPVKVPGITNAIAVQGGEQHVLWLLRSGHVMACGTNDQGQLGQPESVRQGATPVEVPELAGVVEISAGQRQSLARTATGKVYAWGSNAMGQVCMPEAISKVFTPVQVSLPGIASSISAGGNLMSDGHSFFMVNGVPYGCGDDESGQVGDGQTANKYKPTVASELLTLGLTQVVAAGEASVGISSAGEVYTWGSANEGSLGNGSEAGFSMSPLPVAAGAVEVSGTAWDMLAR